MMATHGEAIAEGGGLGCAAVAHRSGQAADEARLVARLDGVDSALSPEALLQLEAEPS